MIRMCLTLVSIAVLLQAAAVVRGAEAVKPLAQPCRAFNVLAGKVVKDPAGKEWFAVTNMNEVTGMELIFIDPATNTAKSFKAPAGAGAWALLEVPNYRLVVGTYYDGTFMIFDLKEMKFTKSAPIQKEEYIWSFALGSDGRVYGGTYRNAKLAALNLDTGEVETFDRPESAGNNLYLRNVSSTPDGRIVCNYGMEKKVTLLFDPKTKQFSDLPEKSQIDRGISWGGHFLAGRQVWKDITADMVPAPFPTPKSEKWNVDVLATTPETLVLRDGNAIFRYRAGEKELTQVSDQSLRGGALYAANGAGDLLGVRGPEYFILSPGKSIEFRTIPVEPSPRVTHYLRYDATRNWLWGGPTFGQTVFHLDLATGKYTNTAKVCDSGGEVYDATFVDGKSYFCSYAGGEIVEYDPDAPWDQWGLKNPRVIASVKDKGAGYIRPIGNIVAGKDKKLYVGWMVKYGEYGGAVSITDAATGDTQLLENPLGVKQAIRAIAVDDKGLLFLGTTLSANGISPKKEPIQFAAYDLVTKEVVFQKDFDVQEIASMYYDAKTNRVVMAAPKKIHVYDVAKKEFVADVEAPESTGHQIVGDDNGVVYYASDKTVHAIYLDTGKSLPFAEAPEEIENVTLGKPGEVFVSCKTNVYRLTSEIASAAP